jgi:hypothetical protein
MTDHIPMSQELNAEVFLRWERRHPDQAARDPDPRPLDPHPGETCQREGEDSQTFMWRGYEPFCG